MLPGQADFILLRSRDSRLNLKIPGMRQLGGVECIAGHSTQLNHNRF